jgi:hypothetical protein
MTDPQALTSLDITEIRVRMTNPMVLYKENVTEDMPRLLDEIERLRALVRTRNDQILELAEALGSTIGGIVDARHTADRALDISIRVTGEVQGSLT